MWNSHLVTFFRVTLEIVDGFSTEASINWPVHLESNERSNSVIPPLLFELGVEIDHVIGPKILLIELEKLEDYISYG